MESKKPERTSMEKEFPIIAPALSGSSAPRAIENNGAPPMPNRFANAVMMVMMGSVSPDPSQRLGGCMRNMADVDAVYDII